MNVLAMSEDGVQFARSDLHGARKTTKLTGQENAWHSRIIIDNKLDCF